MVVIHKMQSIYLGYVKNSLYKDKSFSVMIGLILDQEDSRFFYRYQTK